MWGRAAVYIILRTKGAISTPTIRHHSKLVSLQFNTGCQTVPVSTSRHNFYTATSIMAEQVPTSVEKTETPDSQDQTTEDVEMIQDSSKTGVLQSSSDVPPEQEALAQQPGSDSETQTPDQQVQSSPDEQTQPSSEQAQEEEPQQAQPQQDVVNETNNEQEGAVTQVKEDKESDEQSVGEADTKNTTTASNESSGGLLKYLPTTFKRWFSSETGPRRDRAYYEGLSLEEKRKQYTCGGKYVILDDVPTWEEDVKQVPIFAEDVGIIFNPNKELNLALIKKVSLWRGDITSLEIGAIVNAANSSLLGGGGVDGAIHRAAGYSLRDECATLGGCDCGDAKLTSGHRLPAKYILHTVGPMNSSREKLSSCYTTCLQLVLQHNIRSVAFCCIATGVYGFPNVSAAHIALGAIRSWLETEDNADKVDRIIFCVFLKQDFEIYKKLLQCYFPLPLNFDLGDSPEQTSHKNTESNTDTEKADTNKESNDETEHVPTLRKAVTEPAPSTTAKQTVAATDDQLPKNTSSEVEPPPSPPPGPSEDQEEEQMEIDHDQEKETEEEIQDSKRPKTEITGEPGMIA